MSAGHPGAGVDMCANFLQFKFSFAAQPSENAACRPERGALYTITFPVVKAL